MTEQPPIWDDESDIDRAGYAFVVLIFFAGIFVGAVLHALMS